MGLPVGVLLAVLVPVIVAQDNSITVTSPTSDDEIYAGKTIEVLFEATGDASGPYDVDLHRGDDEEHAWCPTGCDIAQGTIKVPFPSYVDVGAGYKVVVMDRVTATSGTSEVFEVVEAPATAEPSSIPSEGTGDTQVVGGGGGAVGHMNMAMFVVATVVGVVLVGALVVLCVRHNKRRKRKDRASKPAKIRGAAADDIEHQAYGYNGSAQDTFSPTEGRSAKSGKSGRSLNSAHPYSLDDNSESRSRSLSRLDSHSREPSRERDSTTPARSRSGTYGPRMMSTTPARNQTDVEHNEHQQSRRFSSTPGRYLQDDPDASKGPRMYSSSPLARGGNDDHNGSRMFSGMVASWDDQGRPRMYTTTPNRDRGRSGEILPQSSQEGPRMYAMTPPKSREAEKARAMSRSRSVGRERRPRQYGSEDGPGPGELASHVPRPHQSAGRSRSRSPGPGHILGYRRSRSVEKDSGGRRAAPEEWEREVNQRREARGIMSMGSDRWDIADRDPRMIRRSKSVHSIPETDADDPTQSMTYIEYRRTLQDDGVSRQGSDGGSSAGTSSPGRNRFYRSGLADAPRTGHDVSCEELRWRYMISRDQRSSREYGRGRNRHLSSMERRGLEKLNSLPSHSGYVDDTSSIGSLSILTGYEGNRRGPPPPYRLSPKYAHLSPESLTSIDTVTTAGASAHGFSKVKSSSKHDIPHSGSNISMGSTGQARAMHARAAARDAQLSAERALAAAAAASRAADAAAQAATEAEAEADAELSVVVDSNRHGGGSHHGTTALGPKVYKKPGPSSSRSGGSGDGSHSGGEGLKSSFNSRKKVRANAEGAAYDAGAAAANAAGSAKSRHAISRGWSQEQELEVKARAEASAEQAKAALAAVMSHSGIEENVTTADANPSTPVAVGGEGSGGGEKATVVTGGDTAGGSRIGALTNSAATPPLAPSGHGRPEISKSGALGLTGQQSFDSDYSVGGEPLPLYPSTGPAVGIPSPLRPLPRAVADTEEALPKILSKRRHVATRAPAFESSPTVARSPVLFSTTAGSPGPDFLSTNGSSAASTIVAAVSPKREEA